MDSERRAKVSAFLTRAGILLAVVGSALAVTARASTNPDRSIGLKSAVLALGAALAGFGGATHERAPTIVRTDCLLAFIVIDGFAVGSLTHRPPSDIAIGALSVASFALLAWSVRLEVTRDSTLRAHLFDAVVVTSAAIAALVLVESLGVALPWSTIRRPGSTLGNRNFVGGYIAAVLPLAASRAMAVSSWRRVIHLVVLSTALFLTRCRSAWIGAAVSLAIMAAWLGAQPAREIRPRALDMARVFVALGAGFFLALIDWPGLHWRSTGGVFGVAGRLVDLGEGSGLGRVVQHRIGWAALCQHPLLGWGPGGWQAASATFAHVARNSHATAFPEEATPHSDPLRIAVESGALGLVVATLFVAEIVRRLSRTAVRSREALLVRVGFATSLLALGIHALADAPLVRPEAIAVGAVVVGLIDSSALDTPVSRARSVTTRAAAMLLAIACAVTGTLRGLEVVHDRNNRSIEDLVRAERFFSRPYLNASIAMQFLPAGRCAEALDHVREIEAIGPCWGCFRIRAHCAEAAHDDAAAHFYWRSALAIEPHAEQLSAAVLDRWIPCGACRTPARPAVGPQAGPR